MSTNTFSDATNEWRLNYPVNFSRTRLATAFYLVDGTTARAHLNDTGLSPVPFGKKAILSVTWFDYGASDLGAYRELSIGVLVDTQNNFLRSATTSLTRQALTLGAYVLALPVSSELAMKAGVALLGLPKTHLELPMTWSVRDLDATAFENGSRILSMRLPLRRGPTFAVPSLVVYSRLNGDLLRTTVTTDFHPKIDLVSRPQLRLDAPDHPLCRILQSFRLERAPCLAVVHGAFAEAKLLAPEVLVTGRIA